METILPLRTNTDDRTHPYLRSRRHRPDGTFDRAPNTESLALAVLRDFMVVGLVAPGYRRAWPPSRPVQQPSEDNGSVGGHGVDPYLIRRLWSARKEIFGASCLIPPFKLCKVGRARKRNCHTLEGTLWVCSGGYDVRSWLHAFGVVTLKRLWW